MRKGTCGEPLERRFFSCTTHLFLSQIRGEPAGRTRRRRSRPTDRPALPLRSARFAASPSFACRKGRPLARFYPFQAPRLPSEDPSGPRTTGFGRESVEISRIGTSPPTDRLTDDDDDDDKKRVVLLLSSTLSPALCSILLQISPSFPCPTFLAWARPATFCLFGCAGSHPSADDAATRSVARSARKPGNLREEGPPALPRPATKSLGKALSNGMKISYLWHSSAEISVPAGPTDRLARPPARPLSPAGADKKPCRSPLPRQVRRRIHLHLAGNSKAKP